MEKVSVPEGNSGDCKIQRFTVTPEDAARWFRTGVPPGDYTRLLYKGHTLMSDTPDEMRDHRPFVHKASGDILINGLGIGMVVLNLLNRLESNWAEPVTSITVNEISPDVIKLVGPTYQDRPGVTINLADARTWKPAKGQRFDAIWHDIWGDFNIDLLSDMTAIKRRYARWLKPGGWQGCWKQEWLRDQRDRRKRREW